MRADSLDELKEILDCVDQPIWALDVEGRFIMLNKACALARGLDLEEGLGQYYTRFVTRPAVAEQMLIRARAGETVVEKIELARPEGGTRVVVDRLGPCFDAEGAVIGFWGVAIDPPSYGRIAEMQHEADLLRDVDLARANLLSTVSHELRTPLASIQGYASTYLLYEERLEPEERRDFLRRIVDSTLQLEELIDNLLTASRIEHGTLQMSLRPVQLSKLVLEAIAEFQQRWEGQVIEFDGPERCELVLDPRRVRQVIQNLLDNAHKYGSETPIDVCLEDQGEKVRVTVRDRGPGFKLEQGDRLFDRFYRGKTDGSAKGTGLGLWISRAIVEAHHGRIVAASPREGGALFTISLPRGLRAEEA